MLNGTQKLVEQSLTLLPILTLLLLVDEIRPVGWVTKGHLVS